MISYMLVWIITETYFGNQETCVYIPCELVFMQHTNATCATHLGHLLNNLVKHV
jgi:hypothetical protein